MFGPFTGLDIQVLHRHLACLGKRRLPLAGESHGEALQQTFNANSEHLDRWQCEHLH